MKEKYLFEGYEPSKSKFNITAINIDSICDNDIIKEFLKKLGLDGMKRVREILSYYIDN